MSKQLMTGAEIVVKALQDQGVRHIFGYPGGAVLPIYDALFQQDSVEHILVRHEQGAAHAAGSRAVHTPVRWHLPARKNRFPEQANPGSVAACNADRAKMRCVAARRRTKSEVPQRPRRTSTHPSPQGHANDRTRHPRQRDHRQSRNRGRAPRRQPSPAPSQTPTMPSGAPDQQVVRPGQRRATQTGLQRPAMQATRYRVKRWRQV